MTGPATGGVGGAATGGTGGGDVVSPRCNDWKWEPISFGSSLEAQQAIAGRWVLCGGTDTISLPSAPFPSTFEITADGHWYGLVQKADGAYQRSTAFGNSGTVTLWGTYAIDFSGHNMGQFGFSSDPKLMNCGGGLYTELRDAATGTGGGATGGTAGGGAGGVGGGTGGSGGGAPNCNDWSWSPLSFASNAEAQAAIAGRWAFCGGTDTISLPAAPFPSTFEITSDGHWYGLMEQQDGTYQRSMAFGKYGTITLYGPTDIGFSGHGMGQLGFSSQPKLMNCGGGLYSELP